MENWNPVENLATQPLCKRANLLDLGPKLLESSLQASKPELQVRKSPITLSPRLCSLILMYATLLQSCAGLEYKPYGSTTALIQPSKNSGQLLEPANPLDETRPSAIDKLPEQSFLEPVDLSSFADPLNLSMPKLFLFAADPVFNGISVFNSQNTAWILNYELLLNPNIPQPIYKQFQPKATAF